MSFFHIAGNRSGSRSPPKAEGGKSELHRTGRPALSWGLAGETPQERKVSQRTDILLPSAKGYR